MVVIDSTQFPIDRSSIDDQLRSRCLEETQIMTENVTVLYHNELCKSVHETMVI